MIPSISTQLLLCLSPDWDATDCTLQRFERFEDGAWQAVGAGIPGMLGRHGMAWGRGLHPQVEGRQKCEGDGRAPAGLFAITALFAYPDEDLSFTSPGGLPCHLALPELKCVDDPVSVHYNCLVDAAQVTPDWTSCEDMRRSDQRYRVGAVVAHNVAPPLAGAGSCIFLHVWETPDSPTAGCTAMALADMREIAGWLEEARAPLLLQLPQAEYAARQAAWGLPAR